MDPRTVLLYKTFPYLDNDTSETERKAFISLLLNKSLLSISAEEKRAK